MNQLLGRSVEIMPVVQIDLTTTAAVCVRLSLSDTTCCWGDRRFTDVKFAVGQ